MADYKFTIGHYPTKLSPKVPILTGQTFGRFFVIGFAGINRCGHSLWHCICECGNGRTVPAGDLKRRAHLSCGCYHLENARRINTKHGEAIRGHLTDEYKIFIGAKSRCQSPQNRDYHLYGGRGIEFRFTSYPEFLTEMGRRPSKKHSINRIDNNGHYEPGNVEWATVQEQAINRRTTHWITALGKTQILTQWELESPVSKSTINARLNRGWCADCAIGLAPDQGGTITCVHKNQL